VPPAAVSIRVAADDGSVRIEVSDTGAGLDPATAARVFDRFHRGDNARSPGGTGLGLAIVKAVAEAHGGSVAVASSPGEVTTFTLRLPT
jgi:signal transduction histidine kinase